MNVFIILKIKRNFLNKKRMLFPIQQKKIKTKNKMKSSKAHKKRESILILSFLNFSKEFFQMFLYYVLLASS